MKILVLEKNGYIVGSSVQWGKNYTKYQIDSISVRDASWRYKDFTEYEVLIYATGTAHKKRNRSLWKNVSMVIVVWQ